MYTQDFYITDPVGNNAFSYHERKNKKLFVPALKKIASFEEVELALTPTLYSVQLRNSRLSDFFSHLSQEEREQMQEKITFEDYDFDGKLQTCFGLKNMYELSLTTQHISPTLSCHEREQTKKSVPIYLVDNHNHVFYFWYLAREQGIISDEAILYHVDEHADMRDPGEYLLKPDSHDLQKVFDYTNFFLNVGNFIVPAMKEGLIGEVVQIRSEGELREYIDNPHNPPYQGEIDHQDNSQLIASSPLRRGELGGVILNLDLDFFEPELDYIDFELKKQVILDIAAKADLITICTSPFFIEQERALRILRKIFQ